MFCPRCGKATDSEHKFCQSCGAPVGAAGSAQAAARRQCTSRRRAGRLGQAAYPGASGVPPGMVPMMCQSYPGGPQQVYYVPAAQGAHPGAAGAAGGLMAEHPEPRDLASTDKPGSAAARDVPPAQNTSLSKPCTSPIRAVRSRCTTSPRRRAHMGERRAD